MEVQTYAQFIDILVVIKGMYSTYYMLLYSMLAIIVIVCMFIYRIAQNSGGVKLWRIDHFRVLAKKTLANLQLYISHFSESGIWLGKILANDVPFAKFAKVFPRQNFALYGTLVEQFTILTIDRLRNCGHTGTSCSWITN